MQRNTYNLNTHKSEEPIFHFDIQSINSFKAQLFYDKSKGTSLEKPNQTILTFPLNQLQSTPYQQIHQEQFLTHSPTFTKLKKPQVANQNISYISNQRTKSAYQQKVKGKQQDLELLLPSIKEQDFASACLRSDLEQKAYFDSPVKCSKKKSDQMKNQDQPKSGPQVEERNTKKGLAFISSKISQLLRQKRKIKANEIFQFALPQIENENYRQEKQEIPKGKKQSNDCATPKLKEQKQRRNVKRRIYDSINVMVAMGIMKKVKNYYEYVEEADNLEHEKALVDKNEIITRKLGYLQKLQQVHTRKQQQLQRLTACYSKMKILKNQNAQFEQRLNCPSESTLTHEHQTNAPDPKIEFPFLIFYDPQQQLEIQLEKPQKRESTNNLTKMNDWTEYMDIENDQQQDKIQKIRISSKKLNMLGEMDCLNYLQSLKKGQNSKSFTENQIYILRDYNTIKNNEKRNTAPENFTFNKRK